MRVPLHVLEWVDAEFGTYHRRMRLVVGLLDDVFYPGYRDELPRIDTLHSIIKDFISANKKD